ncbi:MAG: class I SAM-dependent methyltransferase [Sedimentisphaerales bacterium]|nr:class I SAM-dependent methyltransferase [Sedimentisphaerales bacterium]
MKPAAVSLSIIFSIIFFVGSGCKQKSDTSSSAGNENSSNSDKDGSASTLPAVQVQGDLKYIREPDKIYLPTPPEIVDKMLELAKVEKSDMVYDLGCGDGRIVIAAAKKYGCRAIGYDIDPERVKESRENVEKNNLSRLVKIDQKDIFTLDLSGADVITLYLLPELNVKLIPQLEKLKPGSRIISHDFDMEGVIPDQVITVKESNGYRGHKIYAWKTPLKKEAQAEETKYIREPDVVYLTTPPEVVDRMLELAKVKSTDLVYDLGCGDGRIVIAAAKKYGCRAVGYDIDPQAVKDARENVKKNNIGNLVRIEQADVFTLDLSDADVVTLYLLPELNVKLIPQLEKLKPGSRIVSHNWDMKGVTPDQMVKVTVKESNSSDPRSDSVIMVTPDHFLFLWTTPLKKE